MALTLSRSTAELQRLTDAQWADVLGVSGLYAVLADTTGAATQPTASSSFATWQSYFVPDNNGWVLFASAVPGASVYNVDTSRAEVPALVFSNFDLATLAPAGDSTVTHVVITDNPDTNGRIVAVIEESPSITVNSSSTLSYTLNAWGEYA